MCGNYYEFFCQRERSDLSDTFNESLKYTAYKPGRASLKPETNVAKFLVNLQYRASYLVVDLVWLTRMFFHCLPNSALIGGILAEVVWQQIIKVNQTQFYDQMGDPVHNLLKLEKRTFPILLVK